MHAFQNSHVRPLLGTLSDLFRMLSPSSVKQIPVRSSLQLQLLSRISQIWLPVDSKSTDPMHKVSNTCLKVSGKDILLSRSLGHQFLPSELRAKHESADLGLVDAQATLALILAFPWEVPVCLILAAASKIIMSTNNSWPCYLKADVCGIDSSDKQQ